MQTCTFEQILANKHNKCRASLLILKLWTKLWFVCQNRVYFEQLVLDAAIIIIPRRWESFIHFLLFWHVNVEGKLNYLKTQVWMEPSLTQKQPDNLSSNRGRGLHVKTKSAELLLMPLTHTNTHPHSSDCVVADWEQTDPTHTLSFALWIGNTCYCCCLGPSLCAKSNN